MLDSAVDQTIKLSDTQQDARATGNVAGKKIWLPKILYDALPYFYLTSGFAAFFATIYISDWFWVLPHYLLFSVACAQLGVSVFRRRKRKAQRLT